MIKTLTITLKVDYEDDLFTDDNLMDLESRIEGATFGLDWIGEIETETTFDD